MSCLIKGRETAKERGGRRSSPFFLSYIRLSIILLLLGYIYPLSSALAQNPLAGFNPASLAGKPDGLLFETKAFCADNALPLQAIFFNHLDSGPFNPGHKNRLDISWAANSGFIYHGWRLAGFYRGEAYLKTNRDSLEILRMINLKQDLPVGRRFDIDVEAKGFSATGFEVSRGAKTIIKGLTIGFTVRYLRGEKIQEGQLKGQITPGGPTSYDFDLFIDYVYDQNLLYDRKSIVPGYGNGYSFDLGLRYVLNKKFKTALLFRDIGGRIYWHNAPYTQAKAISEVKEYDQDGYQSYKPTIQGYESYKNFTQKIALKTDILFSYSQGPFTLTPSLNFIEDTPFYWLGLRYRISEKLFICTGYNHQAFCLGVSYRKVLLSIAGSDIDLSRTKAIGLVLSFRYAW